MPARLAKRLPRHIIAAWGLLLLAGCGPADNPGTQPDGSLDGPVSECDKAGDDDGDCILNELEGCTQAPPADRDNDGRPNHFDSDADNDGIADSIEVGVDCAAPRDTDEDTMPDYLDGDSDNDSVRDQYEDRNGDGAVGTCSRPCTSQLDCSADMDAGPQAAQHCSVPRDGGSGVCVSYDCLGGETDPHNPDSDGDGTPDSGEGTFICNPQSTENPYGLKRIVYADAKDTMYPQANWRIALEVGALQAMPIIQNPGNFDSAYIFDMTSPSVEVAGFLVSRPSLVISALDESNGAAGALEDAPLVAKVSTRISGKPTTSLDGFDTVLGAALEVKTTQLADVTALRAAILPRLLARDPSQVLVSPVGWTGSPDSEFLVVYQTVYRADVNQTVYMGAVVRRSNYDDRSRVTALHADDMSNGTGHSVSGNGEALECEPYKASKQAAADIIWVVDESGSVDDDRERIATVATDFFNQARASGLDFRMGVTDMNDVGPGGKPGIFASRQNGGTGDRWLLPTEPATFAANIRDPSGPDAPDASAEHGLTQARSAMERHLPRDNSNPQKIRENVKLVVIYVTDEKPDEIEGILGGGNVEPNATQRASMQGILAPFIDDFLDVDSSSDEAIAHLIAEPLPFGETCSLGAEHAYGYYELVAATGGQVGSICQTNLRPTIDVIIESIVGEASPIVLSKYPISASIAVARDNRVVPRSRLTGWDYRGSSNSIVFFNTQFSPDNPSDVIVSYRRWADQVPVE